MATWLSIHSAPACGGKVVAPATKGGMHFQRPQGGCMVLYCRMLIMPYGTARSSRNADFISIARRAIHNPRGRRPRQTLEPSGPWGRSILRTFPFEPFEPSEPSEPSHRRCVQWRSQIGGGERSEPISRMLFMTYDADRLIRNADFISIAAERQSTTLGLKGRQT